MKASEQHDSRLLALVVAGGTGTRFGAGMPKQMLPLAGRPILAHTLDVLLAYAPEMQICTVLHASLLPDWAEFVAQWFAPQDAGRLHVCAGGPDRTSSVHKGLNLLSGLPGEGAALVAIHDGVRPFVDARMLAEGFALAAAEGNAVAGVPVKSSLRKRTKSGSEAIDRSQFFHVQTPQIFGLSAILGCYERKPDAAFTDDASLAEHCGMAIHLFAGSYDNLKITTPEDLLLAEQILGRR